MGNSGTSTRLLMGLVATHPITVTFVGDASLSGRPMGRVIDPLSQMGADITASPGSKGARTLPLMIRGLAPALQLSYPLPTASDAVTHTVLRPGVTPPGDASVTAPGPTP